MNNHIKIIILGDCNTGKKSLLYHFIHEKPLTQNDSPLNTSVSFNQKSIHYFNKLVKLSIWDIYKVEQNDLLLPLINSYYSDVQIIFLLFDVTNRESFDNITKRWIHHLNNRMTTGMNNEWKIVLIGNKSDLDSQRKVSYKEANELARLLGVHYLELSSLYSDYNSIKEPFLLLINQFISMTEITPPIYYHNYCCFL